MEMINQNTIIDQSEKHETISENKGKQDGEVLLSQETRADAGNKNLWKMILIKLGGKSPKNTVSTPSVTGPPNHRKEDNKRHESVPQKWQSKPYKVTIIQSHKSRGF